MTEPDVYYQWLTNLKNEFKLWGKTMDDLVELTGITKNNLYAIFKGTRKVSLNMLLFINTKMESKPHRLINIPENV